MITFCVVAGTLLLIYCFPYNELGYSERWFEAFLVGYARLAHVVIRLFDPSALLVGAEIHGRFAVRIIKGCDAMEAKILFVSAVAAFPAAWLRKLKVMVLGVLALTTLNVLRIASLYAAGMAVPSTVEVLHLEVWPFVMVGVATLIFLWATESMTREAAETS